MSLINAAFGDACTVTAASALDDVDVTGLYYHAQHVKPGGLFVAIPGFAADGHDYIDQAIENGAVAVVCERPLDIGGIRVLVEHSRTALAQLAGVFYDHPSRTMTVIGITGTNGKTTTSYLIERILGTAGFTVGVIGTIDYRYCGKSFDNPVTTPESLDLQRILAEMKAAGVTHVVMEISSHALDLGRVHGCSVDVGVFTNLTQDHLDYHKDMATYWACKRKLFDEIVPASPSPVKRRAVINCADPKGRALAQRLALETLTCGQSDGQDIHAVQMQFDLDGIRSLLHTPAGDLFIDSPLAGRHNLENILNAVGAAIALEISLDTIARGIGALERVPGRLERVPDDKGRYVYVDYAHTPDALENVLLAIRALTADRILCIFGCGGDRDRDKRPKMGTIAARLSDLTIVTSDNPRTESPEAIIEAIVAGVESIRSRQYDISGLVAGFIDRGYAVIPDRRQAIRIGIQASRPGDTVLIAGKGHEPYQIIGTQRFTFDDRIEARAALEMVS